MIRSGIEWGSYTVFIGATQRPACLSEFRMLRCIHIRESLRKSDRQSLLNGTPLNQRRMIE